MAADTSLPLVIATILRSPGNTGIHSHVRHLRHYLDGCGIASTVMTPFSWGRPLTYPVFGLRRLMVDRCSVAAGVVWYRHWHEIFLRKAMRRHLGEVGDCVVYAQDPLAARAALRARQGPHQRVILAVHFRISQADEYADSGVIGRDGTVFRSIRQAEREVILQVDGLMYVSEWGRSALLNWLPEAAAVPAAVIANFVPPWHLQSSEEPLADLVTTGRLEPAKNHRFLFEVLAAARRAGSSLTLDVFGEGPSRNDLLGRARTLGLEEQIRFRGFQPGIREYLPRYRAYVHASCSESLPLAIIEAMAAGLPIVAGNTGGISELCRDGVEARFWPLDDPVRAAATLISLLDCEPARLKAAAAASERFRHEFDADVVAPRLWSFLMGGTGVLGAKLSR